MNTAWAHLPNAAHIDAVLEFVKTHAEHPAWDAAWDVAWDATRHAARNAAWNAVIALVVWDSAGELLDRPLADVQALAALDEPAAVMLLAYTTSRENITT